jgi:hypothetical protein
LLSELQVSAEALQSSLPADIDAIDISVQLVSTWLPQKDIQAFIVGHLGIADKECSALYVPPAGKWITKFKGGTKICSKIPGAPKEWMPLRFLDRLFNNTPVQVKDVAGFNDDGSPIYKVNQEETLAAQGKAEQIAKTSSLTGYGPTRNEERGWQGDITTGSTPMYQEPTMAPILLFLRQVEILSFVVPKNAILARHPGGMWPGRSCRWCR